MTTATEVAAAANAWFQKMADSEDAHDWINRDSYRAYVAMLRTGRARVVNGTKVVARVAPGTCWGYVTADALDSAGQNLPDTACIDARRNTAILTWEDK